MTVAELKSILEIYPPGAKIVVVVEYDAEWFPLPQIAVEEDGTLYRIADHETTRAKGN